jgi:hypothetical protein
MDSAVFHNVSRCVSPACPETIGLFDRAVADGFSKKLEGAEHVRQ